MKVDEVVIWIVNAVIVIVLFLAAFLVIKIEKKVEEVDGKVKEINRQMTILTHESLLIEAMNARDISDAAQIEAIRAEMQEKPE